MVRPRPAIGFAPAAAKMRDHAAPAARDDLRHQRPRVMRVGTALESVQQDDERRCRRGVVAVDPVEVPEIAVGRGDPLAAKAQFPAWQQIRPDRLTVSSWQPEGACERRRAQRGCSARRKRRAAISQAHPRAGGRSSAALSPARTASPPLRSASTARSPCSCDRRRRRRRLRRRPISSGCANRRR